ncbi:MAG: hypothetical protein P8N76_15825 [Pirellulaceae bacterium]|nr:hypothetical protein [Pirellulaceae bacterium]
MLVFPKSKPGILIDEMSEIVAYHEAGHAFLATYVGAQVHSVTIAPDWDDGPERFGDTQIGWHRDRFSSSEIRQNSIRVALAGPVAEMLYRGEPLHPGFVPEWSNDWVVAWEAAAAILGDEQRRLTHLEGVVVELYRFLDQTLHWAALAAIADNLLAHDTLESEQVREILSSWLD